jgi:hypothetical protein
MIDPYRKLGRRPSLPHQLRNRLIARNYLSALPEPPAHCLWGRTITDWLWLKNDVLGDCGPAAMYHGLYSKIATLSAVIPNTATPQPTDAEVIAFYSAASGYNPARPWTDQGVSNSDMLAVAQKKGMTYAGVNHKIGPYAAIDATDTTTIRQAVYYLGGCLIGCNLPQDWYDNFGPNKTWDTTNSKIIGGHDVWAYAYNSSGFYIVTWGQPGTFVTWAGAKQNCDEIDAIAEQDAWIGPTERTPQGITLTNWLADVKALTGN